MGLYVFLRGGVLLHLVPFTVFRSLWKEGARDILQLSVRIFFKRPLLFLIKEQNEMEAFPWEPVVLCYDKVSLPRGQGEAR